MSSASAFAIHSPVAASSPAWLAHPAPLFSGSCTRTTGKPAAMERARSSSSCGVSGPSSTTTTSKGGSVCAARLAKAAPQWLGATPA
jgi:hypothetical protein